MKKRLIAILTSLVVLLSFIGPALYINMVQAVTDPEEWYMTVSGVLDSDYYLLYPYEKNSPTIGFSKFGEMIDPVTGTGLNYSGRDPFANEGISVKYWLNGWVLDARYVHRTYGARHLWAFAMFADMVEYGGDWLNGTADPYGAPHGGRKTNGAAKTDDITVLYNGPRLFVAMLTTHLYDVEGDDIWPVLDVSFTIIFNKVKKQVIVLKDIKLTIDAKILEGPVDVQFGDRGEWDLGPEPEWTSYAHFYHQYLETCYNASWHFSKNITREFYYHDGSFSGNTLQLPSGGADYGFPVVESSEFVFVNDVWQRREVDYTIDYKNGVIEFAQTLYNEDVKVYYKLCKVDEAGTPIVLPNLYDLAQIIASDRAVVGYAAFWPTLSDYTVYGWDYSLEPLYNVSQPDIPIGEPEIPFIIGEWDFLLDYASATSDWDRQFRGVTVYGIVNWHDADDEQLGGDNVIDREIRYQLNEVFNPWDLRSAVTNKLTSRHVLFVDGPKDAGYNIPLGDNFVSDTQWDAYCSFAERVILLPEGTLWTRGVEYDLIDTNNDRWNDTITLKEPLEEGETLKILYSTYGSPFLCGENWINTGRYEWIIVGRDAATVDSAGAAMVAAAFKNKILEAEADETYPDIIISNDKTRIRTQIKNYGNAPGAEIGLAGADMFDPEIANQMPWVMRKFGTGDEWSDYYYSGTDYRTALRDDWCHAGTVTEDEVPVTSSNMIGVGGPLANILAYYGNDFAQAIYGLDQFTDWAAWEEAIIPLTCWDITKTQAYRSSETVGYAVISTYKDINGTVLFLIWGHWGRDTYYVTKWFYEEGICQLQYAPPCTTSIIVKIDYESTPEGYKPTGFSIVECLGTISETEWIHGDEIKGGIHDP